MIKPSKAFSIAAITAALFVAPTQVVPAQEPQALQAVEFRLARTESAPGYQKAEKAPSCHFDQELFIAAATALTCAEIRKAIPNATPYPEVTISLFLTTEGQQEFARLSKAHLGQLLALMVDGQVVCAVPMQKAVSAGPLLLEAGFSAKEAKQVVEAISQCQG